MKLFTNAIKEINRTLEFLIIFESILNAAIFFLAVYFLLSLVNLYPILAIIPTLVYVGIKVYVNSKSDKRLIVESKYAPLREKLRTAADNIEKDNPVVNELEEDVISDLKNVGLSSFIQTKGVSYKIFAAIALSFIIVLSTTLNLYIVDLNKFLSNLPDALDNIGSKRGANSILGETNESQDIYGESKLAVLGDKPIDIRIKPVNFEVNVREEGDVQKKQFDEIFPKDVDVEKASASEEKIPEEQQELVKNYFNNVNK